MYPPTLRASARRRIILAICFAILFFFNSTNAALGQESILVDTQFSSLSVLDLASQNLTELINAGLNNWSVAVGPNPRLAFVGTNGSIAVIDLTIGREVKRIGGVYGLGYSAFTPDGKFLLLVDNFTYTLDVIDAVGLRLVRKVNLAPTMGAGAANRNLGSIVVVGTKAYVTTTFADPNRPAIAVVDLRTFVVKPIKIPAGYFNFYGYTSPNAAATPDGQYVVMVEDYTSDFTSHVLLISTKTNQVVHDFPIANDPTGLLVTPVNQSGSVYGYVLGGGNSGLSAIVLDLNPLSPTFGQLLPATEVVFQSFFSGGQTAAGINAEGSRLVVGGYKAGTNSPNPNVLVIDTGKMFTDPTHAIVGQATVAGGTIPVGITVASVMTTPPLTAPTVTNVSGPITNNVPNPITVTGTNFAAGALVRIGTTPPLPATVNSSTTLQVTVPQDAPAQANLDVIVTNPDPGAPQAQQFQSGLLSGGLTINVNPAFQPLYQFAALDFADRSVSVYEPSQGTMIHAPNAWVPNGITFNGDGAEIYGASTLQRGFVNTPAAVAWNPANDVVEAAVLFPGARTVANFCCSGSVISASVNPVTGNAVVFVPVRTRSAGKFDVAVEMVDTDSSSPTFNQVIQTIPVGLNSSSAPGVYAGAATPDGKYVYVDYLNNDTGQYSIAIFDVVHGTVTTVSPDGLGVANIQYYMTVTPDGQSLLMTAYSPNPAAGPIAVLDIGTNPKLPALITTITGTPPGHVGGPGAFYFVSWQVVGNRLFGLDAYYTGAIAVFNFDRSKSNFSQLAARFLDSPSNLGNYLGVSPDGALIYVPTFDMLAVLDANKLISGQNPLITNIGAFRFPYQVTVSPVAINPAQLQITTASLPSGTQYFAYSASLAASGGVPPYTWKITSGSLPPGLTLGPTGEIAGTPTASGLANFTVQVTDSQMHQASAPLSINILPPPVLKITTTSLPAGPQGQAYYAVLAATGGVPPYSWSITAGSLPPGLNPLSPDGVISGTPILQGKYQFTVQVADSEQPPVKVTQPLSITINSSGNTALLQGTYAFLLNVFTQTAGQAAYLGSFVADGNGNITSGVVDFNGVTGGPLNSTLTGTYSMASTGIGTIILNISGAPQLTLAFDLSSNGSGRIIEFDDTNGQGNRGSGVIRKQDTSAFSLSKMIGTYAYGLVGADQGGKRTATAGEFFTDGAGNVTNGLGDINDNGTMTSTAFTGTLSNMDPNSGRVALAINSSLGPSHAAIYVVTSTEFLYIATDSVKNTGVPLLSGTQLRQTGAGSFNNGSLNGISVVHDQDLNPNGGIAEAQAAFFTANGAGSWTYTYDENRGGVISQGSDQGQYSVSSNGRATLGGQGPIFYLVNQNQAFFVGQDSKVEFGYFEPQLGGPFSNASFVGAFAGGNLAPIDANLNNGVNSVTVDGAGGGYSSGDFSGPKGLNQTIGDPVVYNIAPNGRGTIPDGSVVYAISPTKFLVLPTSGTAQVDVYEQ